MSEKYSKLIFAMKHLHVLWDDAHLGSPAEFSRSTRLMQGEKEIPIADDIRVDMFLKEPCRGNLPQGPELMLLQMTCDGWPEDSSIAWAGISKFGAKAIEDAKAHAQHALRLNRNCKLARQLVKLLSAKTDPRCPFGVDAANAPDVSAILASEG